MTPKEHKNERSSLNFEEIPQNTFPPPFMGDV